MHALQCLKVFDNYVLDFFFCVNVLFFSGMFDLVSLHCG